MSIFCYSGLGLLRISWNGIVADISSPFVSYDSINRNGTRLAQIQSFREFEADVVANPLPQYAHLSPNILNDGHNTSLEYAANWTESFLMPLLQNEDFMKNILIFLTYDESATYSMPNRSWDSSSGVLSRKTKKVQVTQDSIPPIPSSRPSKATGNYHVWDDTT